MFLGLIKQLRQKPQYNNAITKIYNAYGIKSKKISGENNKVIYEGAILKNVKIVIIGSNNTVLIEPSAVLSNCSILIKGNNHELKVAEQARINNSTLSFVQDHGYIEIGRMTTIGGCEMLSGESCGIKIGVDCMLSSDIKIRTTDSHSVISLEDGKRINPAKDVIVEDHVWIGKGSWIWKGAKIGRDSVIGFNSIVSREFNNNSLIVGSPAKVVNDSITWDRKLIDLDDRFSNVD